MEKDVSLSCRHVDRPQEGRARCRRRDLLDEVLAGIEQTEVERACTTSPRDLVHGTLDGREDARRRVDHHLRTRQRREHERCNGVNRR